MRAVRARRSACAAHCRVYDDAGACEEKGDGAVTESAGSHTDA